MPETFLILDQYQSYFSVVYIVCFIQQSHLINNYFKYEKSKKWHEITCKGKCDVFQLQ